MSSVIILTLAATGSLAVFRIMQKIAGININPVWGVFFIYLGALISLALYFLVKPVVPVFDPAFKKGALIALLSGIFIVIFDLMALTVYQKGGNISFFTPIVNGGSILIVALVAILFLRESLNLTQFLSILAITGGIFFLTK